MNVHQLKTWPSYFQQVRNGSKTFEVRVNDRDFQVGDTLVLREWCPFLRKYTGLAVERLVTYMVRAEDLPQRATNPSPLPATEDGLPVFTNGVAPGHVVMSIAVRPRVLDEWHEDLGPALWWRFPIDEPPYCGSPLHDDWPGYHTHWTPIAVPEMPT